MWVSPSYEEPVWYLNEMVPPPPALEMTFFERNKVIEEGLETDSASVDFLATKGSGRLIERKRKKHFLDHVYVSLPWSSKAIRRVRDIIQWLSICLAYIKPSVHYQYLEEKKKNHGGNQKSSYAKWVSRLNFILSYVTDVGLCGTGRESPVSSRELRLASVLLSLPCGFDAVTFVFLVPENILMARE